VQDFLDIGAKIGQQWRNDAAQAMCLFLCLFIIKNHRKASNVNNVQMMKRHIFVWI